MHGSDSRGPAVRLVVAKFTVWFATNMELSSVFTGTLAFTLGLGSWPGFVAIVIGVVLGAVPVGLLATWDPDRDGLAARSLPFGRSFTLPAAVQWLSALAWDGLVGLLGAEGVQLVPRALRGGGP